MRSEREFPASSHHGEAQSASVQSIAIGRRTWEERWQGNVGERLEPIDHVTKDQHARKEQRGGPDKDECTTNVKVTIDRSKSGVDRVLEDACSDAV